jgi:hypothetical protein
MAFADRGRALPTRSLRRRQNCSHWPDATLYLSCSASLRSCCK